LWKCTFVTTYKVRNKLMTCTIAQWFSNLTQGTIGLTSPPKKSRDKLKLSHYTPRRRLGGTSVLDGGVWSASLPGRVLPPGKGPPIPIVQEAGWAPEPVWTQRLQEKSFCLCRGSNPDRPIIQRSRAAYCYRH
jgi:hypothetical protein